VSGREHAVDWFREGASSCLVLRAARPSERLPPICSARNFALFTRVLLGEPQKHVGFELGMSASNVATISAQIAAAMGFGDGVSQLPLLLIMASHAATHSDAQATARSASFVHGGVEHRLLSAARPDPAGWAGLSAAECAVVSLLFDRYQNVEIAGFRRTSPRTIANQLRSIMQKVGARGRTEIIARIVAGSTRSASP
jgi:DNA-binding CsgD family transcriptional regulator